jgi:hypothetical protein
MYAVENIQVPITAPTPYRQFWYKAYFDCSEHIVMIIKIVTILHTGNKISINKFDSARVMRIMEYGNIRNGENITVNTANVV